MKIDQTGKRFGKLYVVGLYGKIGNDRSVWVRCDCGNEREMGQYKLTKAVKPARSCGCAVLENHPSTHNLTTHPLYPIWRAMRSRCYNEKSKSYPLYGARGITIGEEWKGDPKSFIDWLETNGYKKGLQIDRKDNDGPYSPDNCRVVTRKVNCNNRRDNVKVELDGKEYTVSELVDLSGRQHNTIYRRLRRGMSAYQAAFGEIRKSPSPVSG